MCFLCIFVSICTALCIRLPCPSPPSPPPPPPPPDYLVRKFHRILIFKRKSTKKHKVHNFLDSNFSCAGDRSQAIVQYIRSFKRYTIDARLLLKFENCLSRLLRAVTRGSWIGATGCRVIINTPDKTSYASFFFPLKISRQPLRPTEQRNKSSGSFCACIMQTVEQPGRYKPQTCSHCYLTGRSCQRVRLLDTYIIKCVGENT